MKVVCLGDSLTYGYGVPRKDCWASLTAARTGHTLVNRGVNGDTTGGMLARFGRDVLEERPQRVLLMGGANDIIYGGSDAPARLNLMAMVRQAEAAGSRTFTVPMSRTALAEYLCADRSAMTRELAHMKAEGLIDYDKRQFTLKS